MLECRKGYCIFGLISERFEPRMLDRDTRNKTCPEKAREENFVDMEAEDAKNCPLLVPGKHPFALFCPLDANPRLGNLCL